jgi:aminopeptidase N
MLRRLVGDEAFFAGLRDFYTQWRFRKAGTDDFRVVMERAAGGRSLARFFERWIYESGTPRLHFSSHVQGSTLTVRFEQKTAALYDVPVTVTVEYDDGTTTSLVVTVDDKITEARIPVAKPVKRVDANKDAAALADVER